MSYARVRACWDNKHEAEAGSGSARRRSEETRTLPLKAAAQATRPHRCRSTSQAPPQQELRSLRLLHRAAALLRRTCLAHVREAPDAAPPLQPHQHLLLARCVHGTRSHDSHPTEHRGTRHIQAVDGETTCHDHAPSEAALAMHGHSTVAVRFGAHHEQAPNVLLLRQAAVVVLHEDVVVLDALALHPSRVVAPSLRHARLSIEVRPHDHGNPRFLHEGDEVRRAAAGLRAGGRETRAVLLANCVRGQRVRGHAGHLRQIGLDGLHNEAYARRCEAAPGRCGPHLALRIFAVEARRYGQVTHWLLREHVRKRLRIRVCCCGHWIGANHDEPRNKPRAVVGDDPVLPPRASVCGALIAAQARRVHPPLLQRELAPLPTMLHGQVPRGLPPPRTRKRAAGLVAAERLLDPMSRPGKLEDEVGAEQNGRIRA
mmetsp:Transcript_77405/g.224593  ORF Transcript_77405/g.224593 Transcript_77405/m.224593 type:complete len:429 (-) Transcript_77405:360-1646(-)